MSGTPKKKLCWNCEGRVSLEQENCPYCAVYLGPAPDEKKKPRDLLAPPYRIVEAQEQDSASSEEDPSQNPPEEQSFSPSANGLLLKTVISLGFLSAGSVFFIFGLVLYFFSKGGTLTLSWSGERWYLYLAGAILALLLGWMQLGSAEDLEEQKPQEEA